MLPPQDLKDIATMEKFLNTVPPSGVTLQICTHSGTFHVDDCMAVYMIKKFPRYQNSTVARSRTQSVWDASDIVLDVGGVFKVPTHLDHHQAGFDHVFDDATRTDHSDGIYPIRLSSAGLVWKYCGQELLRILKTDESIIPLLHRLFYKKFFAAIDSIDNGFEIADSDLHYVIETDVSSRVGIMASEGHRNPAGMDGAFEEASNLVGEELMSHLTTMIKKYPETLATFNTLIPNIKQYDPQGRFLVFPNSSPDTLLWDIIPMWEKENNCQGQLLWIVNKQDANTWNIKPIGTGRNKFGPRARLPENLRGLSGADLIAALNNTIPDAIYVHWTGVMGAAGSLEGALALVRLGVPVPN